MIHKVDLGNGITLNVLLVADVPDSEMVIVTHEALERAMEAYVKGEPFPKLAYDEVALIKNLAPWSEPV